MAINYTSLGRRIKEVRKRRGLSQQELAERIHCSAPYVSLFESGTKFISLELFVDVANELNTSADALLFDSLDNTVMVTNHAFADLISDCSDYEKRILLELVRAAKDSMRSNRKNFNPNI